MIYRVKQLYLSLTAKVSPYEKEFVSTYLTPKEEDLFYQLQVSEQKHCINVATDIRNKPRGQNEDTLIRLALLHDIGKIQVRLNPFEKGLMVILDKLTKGKLKNYTKHSKINNYYHHGEMGSDLLRQIGGYDNLFLQRIKTHHCKGADDDLLIILQKWDDKN